MHTGYEYVDDFIGGGITDQIPEIVTYFEKFDSFTKEQAETLEVVLLNFWSQLERLGDVTVRLTDSYVSLYTSHTSTQSMNGFLECSIQSRGDLQIHVGRAPGVHWGTSVYTPWKELKWNRFVDQIYVYVEAAELGSRR